MIDPDALESLYDDDAPKPVRTKFRKTDDTPAPTQRDVTRARQLARKRKYALPRTDD